MNKNTISDNMHVAGGLWTPVWGCMFFINWRRDAFLDISRSSQSPFKRSKTCQPWTVLEPAFPARWSLGYLSCPQYQHTDQQGHLHCLHSSTLVTMGVSTTRSLSAQVTRGISTACSPSALVTMGVSAAWIMCPSSSWPWSTLNSRFSLRKKNLPISFLSPPSYRPRCFLCSTVLSLEIAVLSSFAHFSTLGLCSL